MFAVPEGMLPKFSYLLTILLMLLVQSSALVYSIFLYIGLLVIFSFSSCISILSLQEFLFFSWWYLSCATKVCYFLGGM